MSADEALATRERLIASECDTERRIVIRGGYIVTMEDNAPFIGDVIIRGSQIEAVRPGGDSVVADAIIVDASNKIVLPGLIDSHVHAWEGQLRGIAPAARQSNYIAVTHAGTGPHYTPDDLAIGERLTAAQAINAGTTTIVDNCHNVRTRAHSDAAIEGLLASGIRAVHAAGNAQVGEAERHLPHDLMRVRDTYGLDGSGLVTLRMYDESPSLESWRFADEHGFDLCLELGPWTRGFDELARSGLMRPGHTYNHCTGVSSETWRRIAASGAAVNLCPRSDSQFGIGSFSPVLEANRAGVQEGLSSDNEVSYAHDLFSEMRTLFTLQRGLHFAAVAAGDADVPRLYEPLDVLRAATIGGALNAGLSEKVGTISPGKRADIVLLSLDDVTSRLWGAVIGTIVHFASIGTVDTVLIDGKLRKWGGHLVGIDYAALAAEGERSRDRLLGAMGVDPDELRGGVMREIPPRETDEMMRSYLDHSGGAPA